MTNPVITSPPITSRDIARHAQVSVGTVYRVLSNEPTVDETRRMRVLKTIEELGYVHIPKKQRSLLKDTADRDHNPAKTITLCFCLPMFETPVTQDAYLYQTLHGAQLECASSGVSLLYNSQEDGQVALKEIEATLHRDQAVGVVLVNYGSRQLIEGIVQLGIPLVIVDPHYMVGLTVDAVVSDYFDGAKQATEHLIKLGHRNIAIVIGKPINGVQRYTMQQRLAGYRLALAEADLAYQPELVVTEEISVSGGEQSMQQLLSRSLKFSGVFCANDYAAIGAIRGLAQAGLRVPDDVSVVGFDDHEAAALVTPTLTTVHSDNAGKGALAIKRLLERINKPRGVVSRTVLPVFLVERASTALVASEV